MVAAEASGDLLGAHLIAALKARARAHGNESRIWIHVYVVCRDTEKEARDYLNHYVVDHGDDAVDTRHGRVIPGREGEAIGALNLFHHQPRILPAEELALGQALADVATIAILQERAIRRGEVVNEQLQAALTSRVIIEQAKGLLAQHTQRPMDQAFDLLRRYARGHNTRLAEVARGLVERTLDPDTITASADRDTPQR